MATNPTDDDPAQIQISGSLDENIQAIFGSYQDKLMWFKKNSFGALYGSRRSNFINRTFAENTGISSVDTIQDCDGKLRWLGNNRKVYEFDGANFYSISDNIDNIMEDVIQGDANSRTLTLTSKADWDAGSQAPEGFADTSFYSGSLRAGATDFGYSITNVATSTSVHLDTSTLTNTLTKYYPDEFDQLRNGSSGTRSIWDLTTGAGSGNSISVSGGELLLTRGAKSGGPSQAMIATHYPTVDPIQGTTIYMQITSATDLMYVGVSSKNIANLSPSRLTNTDLYVTFSSQTANNFRFDSVTGVRNGCSSGGSASAYFAVPQDVYIYYSTTTIQVTVGTTIVANYSHTCNSVGELYTAMEPDTADQYYAHTMKLGKFNIHEKEQYWTQDFDTAISSPTFDLFVTSQTGGNIVYTAQSSSDRSTWGTVVTLTSGTAPSTLDRLRYVKLKANFTETVTTGTVQQVDKIVLGAYSTGTWTSAVQNVGTLITAWNALSVGDSKTSGSSITYQMNGSTNSSLSLFLSTGWTNVLSGNIPTIAVSPYVAIRASFTVSESTHVALLNEVNINFTEGSTVKSASGYFDRRYWLGVGISTTSNNYVMVYDRSGEWQKYTGYAPEYMGRYNSRLYIGNTNGVFLAESGYSDNGAAIPAFFTVKTLAPSNLDYFTKFNELRFTSDNSDATLTPSFQIDEDGTDYVLGSVSMNQSTGIQNLKFPFTTSEVQQGKFISMKWSVSGSTFWRILNTNLYYDKDVVPN